MKKDLLYIGLIAIAIFSTACSGESTSSQEMGKSTEKIMKIGEKYRISKGEIITKISSQPKITIETDPNTGETTATLLEGEAKIE